MSGGRSGLPNAKAKAAAAETGGASCTHVPRLLGELLTGFLVLNDVLKNVSDNLLVFYSRTQHHSML